MSGVEGKAVRNRRRGKHHAPYALPTPPSDSALTRCGFVCRQVEVLPLASLAPEEGCRTCYPEPSP